MPSVLVEFLHRRATMILSATSSHGGSCSHRLKKLEKWNRRVLFPESLVSSMDISTPCGNSVSEYMNSSSGLEQSCASHKQCTCGKNSTIEDSVVAELGNALSRILYVKDVQEQESSCSPASGGDEICCLKMGKSCEELKIHQADSLTSTTQGGLSKCATFPCSKRMPYPVSMDGRDEILDAALHGQSSMNSENPACTRSTSLPTPLKLVSAIKGGREKQGTTLKKLTVTWAPDVYDPPTTSLSHSVKSHCQQRPRTNKKNVKHKHKGKSSRGSNSDKKQYRKYIGNTEMRSKSPATTDRLLLGDFNQSTVELEDFAATGQDSKCGSSFLRASLAKVHISFAEAT